MIAGRPDGPALDADAYTKVLVGRTDGPTAWFEELYAEAAAGTAEVPWDRGAPHRLLPPWAAEHAADGRGRRALVVGCGLGEDAEHLTGLGWDTVAFDVSPSGVAAAKARFHGSRVEYVVADLFALPAEWSRAFDLVVEIYTVQSMPRDVRPAATAAVTDMVAVGGTLFVVAAAESPDETEEGPPWPLARAEVDAFAADGLVPVLVDEAPGSTPTAFHLWRAEFRRPSV